MKNILLLILFLTSFSVFTLDQYIGLTPAEVLDTFGPPDYLYSERGQREEEDDIVFFYNTRLYIYFNQNRVWQLRVDKEYSMDVLDIKIGDSLKVVKDFLGEPYKEYEDSSVYRRPDAGYPLFLRIYYIDNMVNDIYLFRGDY